MNPKRKFTIEVEKELVKRYVSGERSGALAKEYGTDRKRINIIAKRHGYGEYASTVKGGIRGINTAHLNSRIIELHSQNLSQIKIGKEVGLSQSVVSRVLRQNKLKPNNPIGNGKGKNSYSWKGGIIKTGEGYISEMSDEFPLMRNKSGYVPQHRLMMARYLNRPLEVWETVHHIDGNRENNDISNLQLRIGRHGKSSAYVCSECGSDKIKPIKLK